MHPVQREANELEIVVDFTDGPAKALPAFLNKLFSSDFICGVRLLVNFSLHDMQPCGEYV